MGLNILTLGSSKTYTKESLLGGGAVVGKNVTISSITPIDGGNRVTFSYTLDNGTVKTSTMDVMNGVDGIDGTNGKNGKDGQPGKDGTDGIGISNIEKIGTVDLIDTYRITFTDNSTFDYEVKNGKDGQGGTGSGEENVIESIKVNGVVQTVADDKSVDITVLTVDVNKNYVDTELAKKANTSDIPSLDGYVTDEELNASGYLTSHQDISGKVDKVEGKSLISDTEIARLASVDNYDDTDIKAEIAKKANATAIPSKVSELTNDSNYQTAEQVNSTVTTEIAKVVADAPEDLNTLKEMSDWIAGHENDASAMNSAISDNKTAITALQTGKADKSEIPTTVAELTDSADYAKKTDLHSHENKTVLDGITEEKVTAWDKAQENIIETVKVNNQEITPDENKAVNIDLTGYAEHDEIIGENLIPFPYAQPERTTNGITFTFADDGSVIANGTATENADFSVCVRTNFGTDAALMLKPGIYAITGCPEGGSDSTYRIQVQFGDKTELKYILKADYGKGFVFEVTEEYAKYACQIQCHVQKGYTVTDLVFKPMLVLGSVLKEYQPYKLSRESLRKDINAGVELASRVDNQFATATGNNITVNDSVDGKLVELSVKGNSFQKTYGGKNLYNPTLKTNELNGITCTQNVDANGNPDGTYTINGTSTKDRWISFDYITLNPGKYKFIATENNVEVNNLCVSSKQTSIAIPGNIFTIQSKSVCDIGLSTMDKTFNNVLIKPMITTDLNATYDDFVPYTGDGDTLTHDVAELKNDLGGLTFSASGTTLSITDGTNTWTLEANS